ncbi:cell division protein FtsZ [Sphingomonas sp. LHG3443-2]|uniref:cell division protein FtsZ n=1 Tax=Sphingomonas sp. LHG3443-2 TaxID=2804639 RepID=UPI003CF706F2
MSIDFVRPAVDELKPRITVIGVGGAGGNAIANMINADVQGVDFAVANTDAQALNASSADRRIQLGHKITQGLGAGARPEIGRAAAEEAMEEIERALEGAHMCFIAAGMGGGTGTGAAPVMAKAARDKGILTVGVVTKPFAFEGSRRTRAAEAGIAELQQHVDTLIVIPNQNLFRLANSDTTFKEAFQMADEVLQQGVRGITDLMVMPGLINLDFADVRSVMGEMGKAMMGTGEASGDNRAIEAAEKAISNPLLDGVSMKGAKGVIISITGGEDMRLMEVDEAASHIKELVDPDANIIWGSAFNNDLDGKIRVSVVATGIEAEEATKPVPSTSGQTASTKVFTFPARSATATPAPAPTATAAAPAPTAAAAPAPLDLGDEGSDELLLDNEDILTSPVGTPPIAPPVDEEIPAPKREAGTLFERMSSMARAGGKVEDEPAPSLRREPLDIPRFLNRQGNQ